MSQIVDTVRTLSESKHEERQLAEQRGSGIGPFRRGRDVTMLRGLRVGQLLVQDNKQLNTTNIVRITDIDEEKFSGIFVDPNNTREPRMGSDREFTIWGFALESGEYSEALPVESKSAGGKQLQERFLPAGTRVLVEPTASGIRRSSPAANWIRRPMEVTLIDDAPNEDTLDVLDVRLDSGDVESIYDFNIVRAVSESASTAGKEQIVEGFGDNEVSVGFAVATSDDNTVEDNASESDREFLDFWIDVGYFDDIKGITAAGWDQLTDDILTIERNAVRWLGNQFVNARSEGHSDDALVGTVWIDTTDIGPLEDADFMSKDTYVLRFPEHVDDRDWVTVYKGVSDFAQSLIDVRIEFFNLPEEITDQL